MTSPNKSRVDLNGWDAYVVVNVVGSFAVLTDPFEPLITTRVRQRDAVRYACARGFTVKDTFGKIHKPIGQPKIAAPATKLVNRVAIVLDDSGSMGGLRQVTVNAFNRTLQDLKDAEIKFGQETYLTVFKFHRGVTPVVYAQRVRDVLPISLHDYRADGPSTSLWDATKTAIDSLSPDEATCSLLVIVLTDGHENSSRTTSYDLESLIRAKQATDKWTITFQVPKGHRDIIVRSLNVPAGNIMEWEQTDAGVQNTAVARTQGIQTYYTARSTGQRSTTDFFTTDLSKVKQSDFDKLVDLTNQAKVWTLEKEEDVTSFVEKKNKGVYTLGAAYYQLMKTEKIQSGKQVLIQDKATGKVYGGAEARKLIGLPDGADGKVTPGNHANYEVFVQSTSPNRKLPRGTKLVYRLDHTTPSQSTW